MSIAIDVENLSKRYVISHLNKKGAHSIREVLARYLSKLTGSETHSQIDESEPNGDSPTEEFWALKDVTFQVAQGERIAVIGGNGAGKSTLLKILSRITEPTSGQVSIRGKVASLLEVGTGFHPELSGRENIYLNGAILGMPRREIQRKFDQIVNFSDVEKFIDMPVKFYSSGMYVRLAFSVSAWLDPDILIVDEVLSVGDQAFQKKCAERMKELTGDGRTVIFVSHSMAAVKSMCERALYLKNGRVISLSPVEEAATEYIRTVMMETEQRQWHCDRFEVVLGKTKDYHENSMFARCIEGWIENAEGEVVSLLPLDKAFRIVVRYHLHKTIDSRVVPNFHFYTEDGERYFISLPEKPAPQVAGTYIAICEIPPFQFNVGRFSILLALSSYELHNPVLFSLPDALRFEIVEIPGSDCRRHGWEGDLPGLARPRLSWNVASQA